MQNMNAQSFTVRELWPIVKSRSKVTVKALPLSTHQLWPMLKFSKSRLKVTVKVTCSKSMALLERPGHKEHTCQI